jgi:hypothetical protein
MGIRRTKHVHMDGREEEHLYISVHSLESPEEVEQLGHKLLQAALEWRTEIETRGPPGPPAFKTFDFVRYNGNGRTKIASWVEHPWALVRHGTGTSVAFLVQEDHRGFKAWIVSVKYANCEHRWKCRFEFSSTVEPRDLIKAFPHSLPYSPTIGDIEAARLLARSAA